MNDLIPPAPRPVDDFGAWLRGLLQPASLAELAALAVAVLVAWLFTRALRRALSMQHAPNSVLFGERLIDGALFPMVLLLLGYVARGVMVKFVPLAVFHVAIPVLVSLVVIRLGVKVLQVAFDGQPWVRLLERTISWVAWAAMVLWVSGLLPVVLAEMDQVTWKTGSSTLSLRTLVEGLLTASIVLIVALWISAAIEARLLRNAVGSELSLRKAVSNFTRALLMFVGLIVALSAVGIDLTALSVLGGAVGVGIGFGLQKLASNYVSGFVILAERSVRIGDNVRVDNFEGRITDINARYTLVRALNGRESIVPNETLITSRVENLSPVRGRVGQTVVLTVNYDSDIELVERLLLDAVRDRPRVLADPAPSVALSNFGADGLEFTLSYTIDDPENGQLNLRSDINRAILNALRAHHIDIPFPQRVVRVVGQGGGEGAAFSGS
ncbi:mechanosensitive ion channel family protein [Hydrogenophaga crocea]|jgi:small-conductance mechanosensitive channel|uniref:Mechanosensitive ion channel n=1 Tax=Hydrogenophaga crocea TaxID=2716225 RepID=A0A6G8IH74_9BURK|nr:mechanosensitive ion channel domain-containing protein [Hydrogenophaga crocea]QIM52542.1 mechanosensitive ion channel [Hydrogenophaga crocea]